MFRRSLEQRFWASLIALAAMAWGVFLMVLAIVLPVRTHNTGLPGPQPRYPLVHDFGFRVLALVSLPFLVATVVAVLAHLAETRQSALAARAAVGLGWFILMISLIGFATIVIGIYIAPLGVLCLLSGYLARDYVRDT